MLSHRIPLSSLPVPLFSTVFRVNRKAVNINLVDYTFDYCKAIPSYCSVQGAVMSRGSSFVICVSDQLRISAHVPTNLGH
jgi:hypothetical protein